MAGVSRDQGSYLIFSRTKGSISIFLAIMLFVMTFLVYYSTGWLSAKKKTEEKYLGVDLALSSLLADYDRDIYDDYGLTVLVYNDTASLKREFDRINLKNGLADIEDSYVFFSSSINDDAVLADMITKHMEHRTVSLIATELLDKFGILNLFSRFKDLLLVKSVVEDIIFDCEKLAAYMISGLEGINSFDIQKALDGDTEYVIYKIDEIRRFINTINDLLSSVKRLEEYKDKLGADGSFFSDVLSRINIFSHSIESIRSVLSKLNRNMIILEECLGMLGEPETVTLLLADYLLIEFDFSSLLPKLELTDEIIRLDTRDIKGGFFDELLLNVLRDDTILDENQIALLPFISSGIDMLEKISSFKEFFSEFSFEGFFDQILQTVIINEYVIDKFSCETKHKSERMLINEIEYILHGKDSQNSNLKTTKTILLFMRAALNYIAINLDKEKTALARSAGAAISVFTMGAGAGIFSEIIISSWALYEAYEDLSKLLSGEDIAVIKGSGDYSLDLGIDRGQKSPVKAGYRDYLRLFLALSANETKLGRIKNLISINTGMDTAVIFTGLRGGYEELFEIEKGY